jgi:signal transduction histidine kinase
VSEIAPTRSGYAVERVTRTMALGLGIAALIFFGLAVPPFLAQLPVAHPAWTWAVVAAFPGSGVALLLCAMLAPLRVVRMLCGLNAIAHLAGLATLPLAFPDGALAASDPAPWLLTVTTIGTSAGAIAWPRALVWANVVVTSALLGLDRALTAPVPWEIAGEDALLTLLFNTVFAALGLALRRAGKDLDRSAELAVSGIRTEAAARGRQRERERVSALVHDRVLVALLAAATPGVGRGAASSVAADAIRGLEEDDREDAVTEIPARDCVWELQAITTELAPDAEFGFESIDGPPVPVEAARALFEAAAEALRNSIQHGGRRDAPTNRAVHVTIDASAARVTVIDDGPGFAPGRVAPTRLGIRVSIVSRMRGVGGDARIASVGGAGTRVQLEWVRP